MGPEFRYRCADCGNLTRFDVVASRRTRAFHHYSLGGELSVQEEEVLSEVVEDVTCRWCGSGGAVEVIENPRVEGDVGRPEDPATIRSGGSSG